MVFSSLTFLLVFFPAFVIIYRLLPGNRNIKNNFILLSSIFFYSWGGPKFIFAILGVTMLDYFLVGQIYKSGENTGRKKLFLLLSLSVNLGLLFYFKYFNFFIDNFNHAASLLHIESTQVSRILLPIGISFYTFESITYAADVYRNVHKPLNNFRDYQLYITFFPKLIAGPIVRYHDIADQITNHVENESYHYRLHGLLQFCLGLAKKVLIANVMGQQADKIFSQPVDNINSAAAWIGALAYTFQIYFDFSGYSDMAIGLGKIMGFVLPENFNNPYTATSITDFWRRWHKTLGAWMKNYLYIPLGGNRTSKGRLYLNLVIVFLVSGFWHGASWNFVLWGAFHGTFLILDRIFLSRLLSKIGKIPSVVFTFFVVTVSWMVFRIGDIGKLGLYLQKMFEFDLNPETKIITNIQFNIVIWAAAFFSFFLLLPGAKPLHDKLFYSTLSKYQLVACTAVSALLYFVCTTDVAASLFNPFIYFRF